MKKNISMLLGFAVVLVASCVNSYAVTSCVDQGYIYDAVGSDDKRAIVVDLSDKYISMQDKRQINIKSRSSEFAGKYTDCGNRSFFCISGPLEIVIPRDVSTMSWDYNHMSCSSHKTHRVGVFLATCVFGPRKRIITITYSALHGVLSFRNSPLGGDYIFELRGPDGLFSASKYRQ